MKAKTAVTTNGKNFTNVSPRREDGPQFLTSGESHQLNADADSEASNEASRQFSWLMCRSCRRDSILSMASDLGLDGLIIHALG